jgi:hypothetical protein
MVIQVRRRAGTIAAGACLVAMLIAVPSAQAAVTKTKIATPSDLTYAIYNQVSPNTFAVSGTTNGTTGDHVDIRCYDGDKTTTVAANVAVTANGSFSVPAASLQKAFTSRVCNLHAVPAGTAPNPLTPFPGPRLLVGDSKTYTVSGGPNNGQVYDFYTYAQQLAGGFDYDSVAGCGIDDSYLIDTNDSLTTVPFYCNAWFAWDNGSFNISRSELQIDGANAYPPTAAKNINDHATGLPVVTYAYELDKKTGNLVIHDTETFVKCLNNTFPATPATCPSFVATGVTDHRTIVQDHDGHVSWVTDVFTSADGKAHSLDLLWQNDQRLFNDNSVFDALGIEYRFPGQNGYAKHALNDTVSLPNAPGTILIRMHGSPDGDTRTGRAAIVYDRPASGATFDYATSATNDFTLNQTGKVPANGSTRFRFAYVQDYGQANVDDLAQMATTVFKGCTVPNVVGKTLAAAKKAIVKAHCAVGKVSRKTASGMPAGVVISESPKAGSKVDYKAKVSLVVSK